MAYPLSMKYLTYVKGLPYYQRRYPTRLKGHPSLTSAQFKRPLHVPADNSSAIAQAVEAMTKVYEDYISLLETANMSVLTEIELERKARSLLKAKGWQDGLISVDDIYLKEQATEYLLASGVFDALSEYSQHPKDQPKSTIVKIQERAWKRLQKPPSQAATEHKLFSEVFKDFWELRAMSDQVKEHRRDQEIWKKFLSYNAGDALVTEETVRQYLQQFKNKRVQDGVKSSTITKNLSVILAPLNAYNETLAHPIDIRRPKVRPNKGEQLDQKPPLYHSEQIALMEMLEGQDDWKTLYVLIALHTGSHPSEAVQLTSDSFNLSATIPTVTISGDGSKRKNENRNRSVPLVYQVDRIRGLIEAGALTVMTRKDKDNVGVQIKALLKQVNPNASAYSLRHTLRHNADAANVSPIIQMALGGWSAKELGLSSHMAGYGELGKDVIERLKPRQDALISMLAHLPDLSPKN